MNSPPEPGSPSPTTPSSGSPPLDEIALPPTGNSQVDPPTSGIFANTSSSKRQRNTTVYTRDAKSRRKDDFGTGSSMSGPGRRAAQGFVGSAAGQEMNRQKEDLVDMPLAESLKSQFGDPFDDTILKRSA